MSIAERLGAIVNKTRRVPITSRKNLSSICGVLQESLDGGHLQPGMLFTARNVADAIGEKQLDIWFVRKSLMDNSGPTRSIGDLLGSHGLMLNRGYKRGTFVFPNKLPVVENDCMYEHAVYN